MDVHNCDVGYNVVDLSMAGNQCQTILIMMTGMLVTRPVRLDSIASLLAPRYARIAVKLLRLRPFDDLAEAPDITARQSYSPYTPESALVTLNRRNLVIQWHFRDMC